MPSADLRDDEAQFRSYSDALARAIHDAVPRWVTRVAVEHLGPSAADRQEVRRLADAERDRIGTEVEALLATDLDAQRSNPLSVLRTGVAPLTALLRDAGVAPVDRDAEAVRLHPEDVYDLTPAAFADIDPGLHEPGLEWGAAKAHVHLRRRAARP